MWCKFGHSVGGVTLPTGSPAREATQRALVTSGICTKLIPAQETRQMSAISPEKMGEKDNGCCYMVMAELHRASAGTRPIIEKTM